MREIKATGPKKAQKKIPGGQEPVIYSTPNKYRAVHGFRFASQSYYTSTMRVVTFLTGLKIKKNPQVTLRQPTVEI